MPKFVRLEESNCQWVYINPDYVVTIRANPEQETAVIVMASGDPVVVESDFFDVVMRITE